MGTPTWLATPTEPSSPLTSLLLLLPVPTTLPPGEPSTPPLLQLPLLLPPSLLLPLLLLPLLLPVPTTLLPEVALLADSTPELLLDLTATAPDTATALLLTPTEPLSPSTSPLSRLPVPTTLLPRELSTR